MMILNFIEHIPKRQEFWTVPEDHVIDVFVKLVVVWRIFADVAPQYHLTVLLAEVQRFQNQHDVSDVIGKLFDRKLIIIKKISGLTRHDVKLEAIYIDVERIVFFIGRKVCQRLN